MTEVTPEQIEAMLPAVRPTARRLGLILWVCAFIFGLLVLDGFPTLAWFGWVAFTAALVVAVPAAVIRHRIWRVFHI